MKLGCGKWRKMEKHAASILYKQAVWEYDTINYYVLV